ncbi:hypothetical protein [Georgenia sp. AZ-5]|uniref:hypothetical protein n=1 Tax=Georgenia sp. AZ-5 TaxID=3367526 RepID=UPI0037547101
MGEPERWRVSFAEPVDLFFALYVRDAARLPGAPDVPPLDGHVPAWRAAWTPGQRATAARQWQRWWEHLLDHRPDGEGAAPVDGPGFHASVRTPELRTAQVALYPAALHWRDARAAEAEARGTGTALTALHGLGMRPLVKEIEARLGRPAEPFRYRVEVIPTRGKRYWDLAVDRLLVSEELGADLDSLADVLRPRLAALA